MPDNKELRGPADRIHINVNEPYEIEYWNKRWRLSPSAADAEVRHARRRDDGAHSRCFLGRSRALG